MIGSRSHIVPALAVFAVIACTTTSDTAVESEPAEEPATRIVADNVDREPIIGTWKGDIKVSGASIGIIVTFEPDLTGTIDIPQQNAVGLKLVDIRFTPPDVAFDLPTGSVTAKFRGVLKDKVIEGSFEQGGATGTFALEREDASAPDQEVPERGDAVALETPTGRIHGTLLVPEDTPSRVVLIIAGSGPTDRNGNSAMVGLATDNLRQIADVLYENGIGSLRYDKRGVGESASAAGSEVDLRFEHYIDDAARWISYLDKDPRFSGIVIIGHSEGALIGMAAASAGGVDAMISIAGPGRTYLQLVRSQVAGQPEAVRREAERIIAALEKGELVDDVSQSLAALFRPSVQPFLISATAYDPVDIVGSLDIPILIVQGTSDLQVSEVDSSMLSTAQPAAEYVLIDGMNHVLRQVGDNQELNLGSYANINLPLDPVFVSNLLSFLSAL